MLNNHIMGHVDAQNCQVTRPQIVSLFDGNRYLLHIIKNKYIIEKKICWVGNMSNKSFLRDFKSQLIFNLLYYKGTFNKFKLKY